MIWRTYLLGRRAFSLRAFSLVSAASLSYSSLTFNTEVTAWVGKTPCQTPSCLAKWSPARSWKPAGMGHRQPRVARSSSCLQLRQRKKWRSRSFTLIIYSQILLSSIFLAVPLRCVRVPSNPTSTVLSLKTSRGAISWHIWSIASKDEGNVRSLT